MTESVNPNLQSRKYHADVRSQLTRYKSQLPRYNMTVPVNSFPKKMYNELRDFANNDGGFGPLNEIKYNKALLAQNIADADGDKKITGDEVEIYDAVNYLYGNPVIGGVEFSADDLAKIKTIAKNNDGTYAVEYMENNEVHRGVYAAQNSDKPTKFSSSVFEYSGSAPSYKVAKTGTSDINNS